MGYTPPVVVDYGDLAEVTRAQGMIGVEDGVGKAVDIAGVSVAVVP